MSNVDTLMSVTDKLLQQETGGTLVLAGGWCQFFDQTWHLGQDTLLFYHSPVLWMVPLEKTLSTGQVV